MYPAPVLSELTPEEYLRIIDAGRELRTESYRYKREDVDAIQAAIDTMRTDVQRHRQVIAVLEGRILLARRKLRLARQRTPNAGWPLVERRRAHREK